MVEGTFAFARFAALKCEKIKCILWHKLDGVTMGNLAKDKSDRHF